ncbi:hypothetical protein SLS62_005880 [Diatrype stigma]|uniref:BTB domain-containing protein n=1 Tax=Diatrype stigma TaxID=117547 RepID=A0AAN9YPE7_9PEZI
MPEASRKELTLHDMDPVKVHWVLIYIYTGKAAPDLATLLKKSTWPLRVCGDLFIIADFFMLDALMTKVVSMLHVGLFEYAKQVQKACKQNECEDLACLTDDFMNQYFAVAADAYNLGALSLKRLRVILIKFIQLARFIPMHCSNFSQKVYELPEFAQDVLKATYERPRKSVHAHAIPSKCTGCRKGADFYPDSWLEPQGNGNAKPRQTFQVKGYCNNCQNPDKGHTEDYKDFLGPEIASEDSSWEDFRD